jgi:hypothetical protein
MLKPTPDLVQGFLVWSIRCSSKTLLLDELADVDTVS